MTTTETLCTCCVTRPREVGSFICRWCGDQWHADLQAVEGWLGELDTETLKLVSKTGGGVGGSGMPVNLAASRLASEISLWLSACIDTLSHGQAPAMPDTATRVGWLLANEASIGLNPDGGLLASRLRGMIEQAQRLCDQPPERKHYLGICEACDSAMRATKDQGSYRCLCGLVYDIATQLQLIADRLRDPDNNLTLVEASKLLGIEHATLRQRVKRRGIKPVIGSGKGAWYRLGDIA